MGDQRIQCGKEGSRISNTQLAVFSFTSWKVLKKLDHCPKGRGRSLEGSWGPFKALQTSPHCYTTRIQEALATHLGKHFRRCPTGDSVCQEEELRPGDQRFVLGSAPQALCP